MKLIDADELLKHKGNCYDENGHLLYAVGTGNIMRMPAIDAVQVVRCKDCKYFGEMYSRTPEGNEWHYCGIAIVSGVLADDYCSYGERREDGVDR